MERDENKNVKRVNEMQKSILKNRERIRKKVNIITLLSARFGNKKARKYVFLGPLRQIKFSVRVSVEET